MRKPPQPIETTERWLCKTCQEPEPVRDRVALLDHLILFHCAARPLLGTKQMGTHMDFAREYLSTYKWTFHPAPLQEVQVVQFLSGPRHHRR